MLSQIMSQLFKNTTVPPRPGRVAGPARAGLKAAPVSAPHEDAEDQGQADRDRREMGGAAGDRGARLLGPHGHIAVMYAQSRRCPGGAAHSITCHQDKKGRRYRYYVSAALITEAGTDRAQGGGLLPGCSVHDPSGCPYVAPGSVFPNPSFD